MVIRRLLNKEYKIFSKYINEHYQKGHILSKNKKLFDWMYFDNKSKKYNFLIAKSKNKIIATKGYLPLKLYDKKWENYLSKYYNSLKYLMTVRCHLHYLSRRDNNILDIAAQEQIAFCLKYSNRKNIRR